ncbi:MAG: hypothetical protein EBT80_04510 [Chitinophagales bacterium]|nr:hypothetical protein [Chitinophagales bacterium]
MNLPFKAGLVELSLVAIDHTFYAKRILFFLYIFFDWAAIGGLCIGSGLNWRKQVGGRGARIAFDCCQVIF